LHVCGDDYQGCSLGQVFDCCCVDTQEGQNSDQKYLVDSAIKRALSRACMRAHLPLREGRICQVNLFPLFHMVQMSVVRVAWGGAWSRKCGHGYSKKPTVPSTSDC
jgi:hypothetical protein